MNICRWPLLVAVMGCLTAQAQTTPPGYKNFEIALGTVGSTPLYLLADNGKLYFYGTDGTSGREPHMVSGGVVSLIKNIHGASNNAIGNNYRKPNAVLNGKYYFTATDGAAGEEMYMYDGTNAPTLFYDPDLGSASSGPDNYLVLNNRLYFTASEATTGQEMYMYDGANTPTRITDISTGSDGSVFGPMVAFGGKIIFAGKGDTTGTELWQLDPTNNTPTRIADIDTGSASSNPANLTVHNGKLYFSANTFGHGRELYEYDGTNAPKRISDTYPGVFSGLTVQQGNAFAWFNGKLYFSARDEGNQHHLWSYDGTTVALAYKLNPGGESAPRHFAIYNNTLCFAANDGANGIELYSFDGTNAPTLMADLCMGPNSSAPAWLTVIGNDLYFAADDCNGTGNELLVYNHTKVGVRNVRLNGDVSVFPNPVAGHLNVQLQLNNNELLRIRLTDMAGRSVYNGGMVQYNTGTTTVQLPMQHLPAGNYVYSITNTAGTTLHTGKVAKQ